MRRPIGIIGGSGLYHLLPDADDVHLDTPFGPPSDPLVRAEVADRTIVFVPRHGRDHRFPPHRVPYRANLWALHACGVRQVLGPCAVGALDTTLAPGDLVIPDQIIDRTGRTSTFYDCEAVHVPFADPYCPQGRAVAATRARSGGWAVTSTGTLVVIPGPRFASRAESQWLAAAGGTVVNMTAMPEAALARELGMCYTSLALVTDLDAGISEGESVRQAEVFEVFRQSTERVRSLLLDIAEALDDERSCPCSHALDGTDAEGHWQ